MAAGFVGKISKQLALSDMEERILTSVDVRSWEDIQSLASAFPSISQIGVEIPKLSNAAVMELGATFANALVERAREERPVALGAIAPPNALFALNARVGIPLPTQGPTAGATLGAASPIDLRISNWPVRNQGQRGTCVAHGAAACVEHFTMVQTTADLSEQFLYWAIKTKTPDPHPNSDGTWLLYADQALTNEGICAESVWPYVPTPVNPVSGQVPGKPTVAAIAAAAGNSLTGTVIQNPAGAAAAVLSALGRGRVVGICLPVFADPLTPNGPTNWTTNVGFNYGHVLNPPPTSKVVGGHCVCITGYIYDSEEPTGGYFIIRNSWDVQWGALNPSAGVGRAPEQGYGDISATYVDKYCWELFHL